MLTEGTPRASQALPKVPLQHPERVFDRSVCRVFENGPMICVRGRHGTRGTVVQLLGGGTGAEVDVADVFYLFISYLRRPEGIIVDARSTVSRSATTIACARLSRRHSYGPSPGLRHPAACQTSERLCCRFGTTFDAWAGRDGRRGGRKHVPGTVVALSRRGHALRAEKTPPLVARFKPRHLPEQEEEAPTKLALPYDKGAKTPSLDEVLLQETRISKPQTVRLTSASHSDKSLTLTNLLVLNIDSVPCLPVPGAATPPPSTQTLVNLSGTADSTGWRKSLRT